VINITTRTTIVSNVQLDGYDCWKRKGLSWRWKLENVGAETTSSGSPFQIRVANRQMDRQTDRRLVIHYFLSGGDKRDLSVFVLYVLC